MNALRSRVVVDGLFILLGLQSTALPNNSPDTFSWFDDGGLLLTWVAALIMGLQIVYIVVMMVHGIWRRRKEGTHSRRGRLRHRD